jgi:anti-sigma-K factor RskA
MPGPLGLRLGSNPAISSQGPWADAHPTQRMVRAKQRSKMIVASSVVAVAVLLAAVTVGLMRMRTPTVALAGRTSAAMNASMEHLHKQLATLKAEAEAAEKAKRDAEVVVIEPSELPNVKPSAGAGAPSGQAAPPGKTPPVRKGGKNDPHGGVENSGI